MFIEKRLLEIFAPLLTRLSIVISLYRDSSRPSIAQSNKKYAFEANFSGLVPSNSIN